jgi:hypothetical protein
MGEEHVRNIILRKTRSVNGLDQGAFAVQIIMAEELCILFIPEAVVDEDQSVSVLNEEATHGPCAEVVFISRVCLLPYRLGNHTKHRASIQFEKTGINDV